MHFKTHFTSYRFYKVYLRAQKPKTDAYFSLMHTLKLGQKKKKILSATWLMMGDVQVKKDCQNKKFDQKIYINISITWKILGKW